MHLLKFFHTEYTSKQQKMVAFVRNRLVSVVMNMVPMLLRQFKRLAQWHCWSYAKSLKQLILKLHLWKNSLLAVYYLLYWRYKPGFSFFCWKIKMSNLLHVELILIISKVFTILCLFCLCTNREYTGNFQNQTVISKPFFQMSAQVKWEGRPFCSGEEA